VDANFWPEKEIGPRVCAWLNHALDNEDGGHLLPEVLDELTKCLDTLIRSGIAQAREVEDKLASQVATRKTA
jgi:hypothetical protein